MVLFKGSCVALITPFTENGIDFDKLGELIDWHIEEGTDAILVCGTTGEATTMNDEEQKSVISYAVKKVNKRVPLIAGTGSNCTKHSIELSQFADKEGADALLVITPYYNKATESGLIAHFTAVADSVNTPIIIYNVPGRTCVNILPSTIAKLSSHPNICGVKEASGNISQVAEIARLCAEDFAIYSGNDDMIVPLLSLGGVGVISVVANIAPKDTHNLVMKYLDGNVIESRKLQLHMKPFIDALFIEVNPIPVKTALNLIGKNVGKLRLPLTDMSEKNLNILKEAMKNYGCKI